VESKNQKSVTKVITVRLPQIDAERAELVARVAGVSVNDVFRRALDCYFATLRLDEDFVSRAQARLARESEIVSELV
jgi:hypothetical protein